MNSVYIKRKLIVNDKTEHQDQVFVKPNCYVVLAEPGAGKSELLLNLAESLKTSSWRAAVFRFKKNLPEQKILIIDGLDEVAKVDNTPVDEVLAKASELDPCITILASRSSEWDAQRNNRLIKDFFGVEPVIVKLLDFDESEQRSHFLSMLPKESFESFLLQVNDFELAPLLGNPLFLEIFAKAYAQSNGNFESKKKIFIDATFSLAKELNPHVPTKNRRSTIEIIEQSEEMFTKLILSGTAGLSSSEITADENYPFILDLESSRLDAAKQVLDTRLFKLVDTISFYEPVHRVIAEYLSARYLAARISNGRDHLTLSRCLSVIAPNGVVRNELRGMFGWLASLGNEVIQKSIIEIDAYAVLANGDPSQLLLSSKLELLKNLKSLSEKDPYFRLSDQWRKFNTKGFFTEELVEPIKDLLTDKDSGYHLSGLLLELLHDSSILQTIEPILSQLLTDESVGMNSRTLSLNNLLQIKSRNHSEALVKLVNQKDKISIKLATSLLTKRGIKHFGMESVHSLLAELIKLYPNVKSREKNTIESKYFLTEFVNSLSLSETVGFLGFLSSKTMCTCGVKHNFQCYCRDGISKIMGRLLDRYFEIATEPFEPEQIWIWLRNLNYHNGISTKESKSVDVLQKNTQLRQALQFLAFNDKSDHDSIWGVRLLFSGNHSHSGLVIYQEDELLLTEHAYANDNVLLWKNFYRAHNLHEEAVTNNPLRTLMRMHAGEKPIFMKAWSECQQSNKRSQKEYKLSRFRFERNRITRENKRIARDIKDLNDNRELIKNGKHFGWLRYFADLYLFKPDYLGQFGEEIELIETSLQNCISFLTTKLPSLKQIAILECEGKENLLIRVLYAGCLALFRRDGSLSQVNRTTLTAIKTDNAGYPAVEQSETNLFDSEIVRCLFKSQEDIEEFCREYFETQFAEKKFKAFSLSRLKYQLEFKPVLVKLPLQWLNSFSNLPYQAESILFELAALHGSRKNIEVLIIQKTEAYRNYVGPLTQDDVQKKNNWFLRYFFFLEGDCNFVWPYLLEDKNTVLSLYNINETEMYESSKSYPKLNANKIYKILDSFIDVWPKVNLPSHWGTGSSSNEKAYRYLTKILPRIGDDDPETAKPVLIKLLADKRFTYFYDELRHLEVQLDRKAALRDFQAPSVQAVMGLLDKNRVATVEDLRALVVELLDELQSWIKNAETNPVNQFYDGGKRLDENTARDRIVDRLKNQLNLLNVGVNIETHMNNSNRCDITAEASINGDQNLLVIEVKGQWHNELYSAASTQLFDRYSQHPNAAKQGIYLVLWYGKKEKIAGKIKHKISTPFELLKELESYLPSDLKGRIDIFVLDLSRI